MKNWLKKQKYKIAIALCSLLSIFTLFLGINKTYAYETNQFTYTIDSVSIYNATITPHWSYDANTHVITSDANRNDSGQLYLQLHFNNTISYYNSNFLLNYNIEYSTDNINFSTYYTSSSSEYAGVTGYRVSNFSNSYSIFLGQIRPNIHNYNSISNMFTIIANTYSNNSLSGNDIYVNLALFSNTSYYYRITILNIDYVSSTDIGLQQYYDTYYGQIEDNYTQLLSDYNDLQDDYDTLETNYNTLESNYNTLDNDYNNLQSEYNNYANFRNYNDFYNLTARIQYDINNTIDLTFNELINDNILSNNQINLLKIRRYLENNNLYNSSFKFRVWFYFDTNFVKATFGNIYWLCKNNNLSNISIDFEMLDNTQETYTIQISIDSGDTILNYDSLINNQINGNYNNTTDLIDNIYFNFNYELTQDYIITSQGQYAYGYNVGYLQGYNSADTYFTNYFTSEINSLNNQIDTLESTVTNLQYDINIKDAQINSYQQGANDYNLNKMIWTIASTPFESFKQIWNVNFFGVNISTMITGFITGIIVLWIVKKFFL